MKIEGVYTIHTSCERVFDALIDPHVLEQCIPGCEQVEKIDVNKYLVKLFVGIGFIKGSFSATWSLSELKRPEFYRAVVEGKGKSGFVNGVGELKFVENSGSTSIQYSGEVYIGGQLASMGQRIILGVFNTMVKKFFSALERETIV